ncbi:zinc finger protein OZF-like [Malaya genurostris]|uniref:zinc finger protein OZF-like n=1 Tax=Malaya genurostris TaxID=325434 RepID=UPI0026F3CD12|nr:zinc finger protein OZF-like [Malaya genurostris]
MALLEINQQPCRVCSESRNNIVSLDHIVDGKSIVEMLRFCVKLEIHQKDGLPYHCCDDCKTDLLVAYKFMVRCLNSETIFRSRVKEGEFFSLQFEQINVKNEEFDTIKYNFDSQTGTETVSKHNANSVEQRRAGEDCSSSTNPETEILSDHYIELEQRSDNEVEEGNIQFAVNHCDQFGEKNLKPRRRQYLRMETLIPKRCCKCKTRLQSMDEAEKHSKVHIDARIDDPQKVKARPFECPICFRRYTKRRALVMHQRQMYIEKLFHCQDCNEEFLTETELKDHKESHSKHKMGRKGQLPKCCACYAQFETDELVKQHAIEIHLPESKTTIGDSENQFTCDVCFRRYKTKRVLLDHKSKPYRTKQYQCSQCGRIFRDKCALSDHERCHQGEQPFVCPVCSKRFAIKDSFRKHVRSHTIEEDRFKCEICSKGFKTKGNLKDHHITHSSDYRPLNCSLCSANFARKSCLKSHMRMHTGEKPFKCDMCDASYAFSSDLKRHVMAHKGIKPYICNVCGRGYPRQDYLRKHVSSHFATN